MRKNWGLNSLNKMADLKSKIGEEDRNFLKQLEERCHILRHDSSVHPPLSYDDYHFVTLTTPEVKKILSIAQKNDDVFSPDFHNIIIYLIKAIYMLRNI